MRKKCKQCAALNRKRRTVYVILSDGFPLDAFKTLEQAESEFNRYFGYRHEGVSVGEPKKPYIVAVPYYKFGQSPRPSWLGVRR